MAIRNNLPILKGGFPFIKNMVHDRWLAINLAENNSLGILDEKLIRYRLHPSQETGGRKKQIDEYIKINNVAVQDQAGYSLSAAAAMVASLSRITTRDRAALWNSIDKIDINFGQDPNLIIPFGVKWDEKHDNAKAQPVVTQIINQQLAVVSPKELATAQYVVPVPPWTSRN